MIRRVVPFTDVASTTEYVRREVEEGWRRLLASNNWIGGATVEAALKQRWAQYCGTSEAVGVANGTDALHLSLRALGVGLGDEVLVPANTFIATVEAVVLAGARPRFVDVDPDTLLLTADMLEAAITPAPPPSCRSISPGTSGTSPAWRVLPSATASRWRRTLRRRTVPNVTACGRAARAWPPVSASTRARTSGPSVTAVP